MPKLTDQNGTPGICPEARLLLGCARAGMNLEKADQIKVFVQKDMSWTRLIKLAFQHRMMPLLYGILNATYPEYVSQTIMDLLHSHFQISTQRNHVLVSELITILSLFNMHDIPVMSYKGPILANSLYPNPAFRECGDLDLLVRKKDVAKAKTLLIKKGYYLPEADATDEQQIFIFQYKHSYNLFCHRTHINVDLHWRFTQRSIPFDLDLDRLWGYLVPIPFAGTTVLSPSPEILLVLLCVHGAKHFNPWERLIWICDVARVIEIYQEMDWERVFKYAVQLGSMRMLSVGILLVDDLLEISVPEEIAQRVTSDPIAKVLAIWAGKRVLFESERATQYDEKAIPNLIFHLRMRERLRDRLSTFLRLAHRRLSFNPHYRRSLTTLPLQVYLPLLACTLHPSYGDLNGHFQNNT